MISLNLILEMNLCSYIQTYSKNLTVFTYLDKRFDTISDLFISTIYTMDKILDKNTRYISS